MRIPKLVVVGMIKGSIRQSDTSAFGAQSTYRREGEKVYWDWLWGINTSNTGNDILRLAAGIVFALQVDKTFSDGEQGYGSHHHPQHDTLNHWTGANLLERLP